MGIGGAKVIQIPVAGAKELEPDHSIRVAAGAAKTLNVKNAGQVTVEDNTFQTTTGTYSEPAGCAAK